MFTICQSLFWIFYIICVISFNSNTNNKTKNEVDAIIFFSNKGTEEQRLINFSKAT